MNTETGFTNKEQTSQPVTNVINTSKSPFCRLKGVGLGTTQWTNGFWAERFRQCHEVTLPFLYRLMDDPEQGHALTNLRIAAGLEQGKYAGTNWQDEWVYKWLEAASYVYDVTHDESLDQRMDAVIAIIGKAQEPDGYLATQITVRGWPRFQRINHHELYVMGHLVTAACVHYRVTGKDTLLNVARRVANYLHDTFSGRDPALAHFGFNPSYIMALVELYRTTGDQRYLDLANVFIDMRGSQPGGSDNNQDHVPLREEEQVVGHMVLATYLYCGAADAYMETGDATLLGTLERLWYDQTERKMYVHGGVCPIHRGLSVREDTVWEAADVAYRLPNSTAYNETCAQIGTLMWNWRMLLISGEARYADIMERCLYNSVLSGIGLDGTSWFYTNVLRWYGSEHPLLLNDARGRFQPGKDHVCCPSNLLRTVAGLHGYAYSVSPEGLWVNLYGANTFRGTLESGQTLGLTQETNYPWDDKVTITIDQTPDAVYSFMLRIPGWVRGTRLLINGSPVDAQLEPGVYAAVRRRWAAGDVIQLTLPLEVRLVEGHPQIEETRNQVAVMRGPLVYCLESPDLPEGVRIDEVYIQPKGTWALDYDRELLDGVTTLEGDAFITKRGEWGSALYRDYAAATQEHARIRLIPYYAWSNRGPSEMTVWLPLGASQD